VPATGHAAAPRVPDPEALERRYSGYAAKFVNECDGPPTDENLRTHLAGCVRPPRPAEYDAIRPHVTGFRTTRMLDAITDARIPGLANLRAGRDDDGPMIHFDIDSRLQGGVRGDNTHPGYGVALGVHLDDGADTGTRQAFTAGGARADTLDGLAAAVTALAADVRARFTWLRGDEQ
jgi:hypothetical protein